MNHCSRFFNWLSNLFVAIKEIFHNPTTVFWTGKAMDLIFHGFDVDCRSDDFNSKATCSVFEGGDVKAVWPKGDEEDMFLFALLGGVILMFLFLLVKILERLRKSTYNNK